MLAPTLAADLRFPCYPDTRNQEIVTAMPRRGRIAIAGKFPALAHERRVSELRDLSLALRRTCSARPRPSER
jgi:hypothetical protein